MKFTREPHANLTRPGEAEPPPGPPVPPPLRPSAPAPSQGLIEATSNLGDGAVGDCASLCGALKIPSASANAAIAARAIQFDSNEFAIASSDAAEGTLPCPSP